MAHKATLVFAAVLLANVLDKRSISLMPSAKK
jgi:hypothetical protein